MYYVADTIKLVADGVIEPRQAVEIKRRAREAMVALCVNTILIFGITAATLGLVFYLANALSVALCGGLFLATGLIVLRFAKPLYRMFGNASALIGAGMLLTGTVIESFDKAPDIAGEICFALGGVLMCLCAWRFIKGLPHLRFAYGAVLLMAAAMNVGGLFALSYAPNLSLFGNAMVNFYAFVVILGCGFLLDIRLVTALAIVPFAQMLSTGTSYYHASYAFFSPEPTLTIVQMALLVGICLWVTPRFGAGVARNAGVLAIMGLIVGNLAFLVGSLFGDVVGETIWGPQRHEFFGDYEQWSDAHQAFIAKALTISDNAFAVVWAILLAGLICWAAMTNRRGLFNTSMTFAGIHGYTQMFESFYDQPLAYVIGGLAAIPLAFGLWRLNAHFFQNVD
ncbi:hypothetical protein [Loktanella sp. S4079]|uniref:hypothetical protein n=1 Tax=Loktanella sp. S4079 TaxID=579483 RepID=UPI0005F9EFF1|nr:hypothetical protein [Loktanella sp. S4079]KJZ17975.1 membrane protein [Loktanella sp. S4079]